MKNGVRLRNPSLFFVRGFYFLSVIAGALHILRLGASSQCPFSLVLYNCVPRAPRGESIEKRPEVINQRTEFAHWEMDCVEGKKGTKRTLLVLTERLTREEIIMLMQDHTAKSVVKSLDKLEKKYGAMFKRVFKTITVDNGSEFSDCKGIERSVLCDEKRAMVFYCHPYCSWERGSNENQNKLIRRHIPKGSDIREFTHAAIEKIQNWINTYPREIFNFRTSEELFQEQLALLT